MAGSIMRSLIFSFVLFFTLCISIAQAKFLNLNEIGEASCRVRVSGSAGSGTSIAADSSYVYILTNAHVVGSSRKATCEFFRYGRKTQRIPGSIIWKAHSNRSVNDFAIIRIDQSLFGEFPPRIVQLAPADHIVRKNDYIASAGCPQARWLQLWEGHALSEASNNRVLFTPPPLGGQSGSGVYTVIDGHTYLCAVLTWKIDGNKGGAIHIGNFLRAVKGEATHHTMQVPATWEYAATPTESLTGVLTKKAYYALGANGIYYLQNFNQSGWEQSVTFPIGHKGIKISKWNVILEVQCPGGRCPPFITPPNNAPPSDGPLPNDGGGNANPYGVLPPNFGQEFTPDTTKKLQEYQTIIEALKGEIGGLAKQVEDLNTSLVEKNNTVESLTKEKEILATTISDKESALGQLNKDLSVLTSGKSLDNAAIVALENSVSALQGDVASQLTKIGNLQEQLHDKSYIIDGLANENEGLQRNTVEVKSQRNILGWLFGGTTTGGLLWILSSYYWKIKGKTRMNNIIEDKLNRTDTIDKPTIQATSPQPQQQPEQNNDLRGLADYLKDTLESTLDNKIGSFKREIDEKIDHIEKATTKDIDLRIYNTVDDRDRVNVSHPTTPTDEASPKEDCESVLDCVQEPEFPKASDRIKDFVELKKSDGEKVEELAFYAHLYKEAVDLLKRDRLIITKKAAPFKVNSQVKAAEAIDAYVQTQFLKRVSSATISRHVLYHEAMIGFLYKQAIRRLKRGEFNVLGYKEVAESIEKWVKTEFMRRMGFDF